MFSQAQDFMTEQMQTFAGKAQHYGSDPLAAFREGFANSADSLKGIKQPVRVVAHAGVKLTALSQQAAQDLIELQSHMATATLTELATSLERVARARDLAALATAQFDALRASAERVVNDTNRAVEIVRTAGRGVQELAVETYDKVTKPVEPVVRAKRAKTARKAKSKAKAKAA